MIEAAFAPSAQAIALRPASMHRLPDGKVSQCGALPEATALVRPGRGLMSAFDPKQTLPRPDFAASLSEAGSENPGGN